MRQIGNDEARSALSVGSPIEAVARWTGASRWTVARATGRGWAVEGPRPSHRDEVLVQLLASLPMGCCVHVTDLSELGMPGRRLAVAGVESLLVLADQAGRVAAFFEDPQPERVDPLVSEGTSELVRDLLVTSITLGPAEIDLDDDADRVTLARMNAMLLERARIAGVIHEGITQVLTNVAVQMEVFDQVIEEPDAARKMLRSLRAAVLEALDDLRGAILELTPNAPEWTDLASGLGRFAADFAAQWGLDISFELSGEPRDVSPDTVGLVFAFAQEALSNVRKHSEAMGARVILSFEERRVVVQVVDDGKGFERSSGPPDGFRKHQGLQILATRVRLEDARMNVESSPGTGTKVTLEVPASAPSA